MKFKLVEALNTYRYTVVQRNDFHYQEEIDAYSYKQAFYLAKKKHPRDQIYDMYAITDNKDDEQLEMQFEDYKMRDTVLNNISEELNQFEVYDYTDRVINSFDDESEAIAWAIENDGEYVADLSAQVPPLPTNHVWDRGYDEWAKCEWCEEYFPEDELTSTDVGHICKQCYDAIRSHGEPLTVYDGYDDDISEFNY